MDRKGLGEFTGQKIRSKSQKLIEKSLEEFLDLGKNLKNRFFKKWGSVRGVRGRKPKNAFRG